MRHAWLERKKGCNAGSLWLSRSVSSSQSARVGTGSFSSFLGPARRAWVPQHICSSIIHGTIASVIKDNTDDSSFGLLGMDFAATGNLKAVRAFTILGLMGALITNACLLQGSALK
eukprot:g15660.t1